MTQTNPQKLQRVHEFFYFFYSVGKVPVRNAMGPYHRSRDLQVTVAERWSPCIYTTLSWFRRDRKVTVYNSLRDRDLKVTATGHSIKFAVTKSHRPTF